MEYRKAPPSYKLVYKLQVISPISYKLYNPTKNSIPHKLHILHTLQADYRFYPYKL